MMRSLFSGVSGLKNHQTRMDVIGNNISNVNTTGFKSSRVAFTDILSQNLQGASAPNDNIGGTNPKQIGLGSAVGAVDLLFTNGSVQSTGVNTDLALSSSNALFILDTGSGTAYTRNGDFSFDADGNYVQAGNGYFVQGWMANNGTIDTGSQVSNITIPSGKSMAPTASTTAVYTNNLNAEVPTIVSLLGGTVLEEGTTIYTKKSEGALTGTTDYPLKVSAGGSTFDVPEGTYSVEDNFTIGKDCTKTTGDMTGTTEHPVAITAGATGGFTRTSGTFSIDGDFKTTTTDEMMKANSTYPVKVYYNDGGTEKTTTVDSGSYKVGGKITVSGTEYDITGLEAKIVNLSSTVTQLEQKYAKKVSASADNPATIKMSDGSSVIQTSGVYTVEHSLPIVTTLSVYDTLGSVHDLPVYFTLTDASEDTWEVTLTNDGTNSTSWKEADGSITTVTMDAQPLDFDTNGAYSAGSGKPTITLTNGATNPQTIQLDFTQMTQYSSSSTIAGKADGNAAGVLSSISIDKTGTITGTYTNGMKQVEAQVALQRFTNPGGLTKVGESLYEDSNNAGKSGEPSTAATLGATITPAALEMSNVDVANEFTDMIITQRGFQSNSKIITVSDEMLETLINLKR